MIHETAKQVGYQFECKKDALRQVQDGGVKITFTVDPNEMPPQLYSDAMGQRYLAVLVPLNDDETPREKPKSYAGQAKMLVQDVAFHQFMNGFSKFEPQAATSNEYMEENLEHLCGVKSCSEIIEGTEAGRKFKRLQAEYLSWRDREDYYVGMEG